MKSDRQEYLFKNTDSVPVYLQVESWADLYYLLPNESLLLVVYREDEEEVLFENEDTDEDNLHILFILNCCEYYIYENGLEINHMDYGSNVEGYSSPLHPKSSLKGRVKLAN